MSGQEFLEPFTRMLEQIATPHAVRAVESGESFADMWSELSNSGFLDALVPEENGGAGLSLQDVEPLIEAIGAFAVPLPVAETMVARALLARNSIDAPSGPIALMTSAGSGAIVLCGLVATHLLAEAGTKLVLISVADLAPTSTGVPYSIAARMSGDNDSGAPVGDRPLAGLRGLAAVVRAALIAGAASRLTELTAAYANERMQFGKPIGKQQALQQNLAVMAVDMIGARIAVQLACAAGLDLTEEAAATAKSVASVAAARIAATAHAVHGAIGVSEEFDLQLLTRRLHEWRLADGSEGYWHKILGEMRLAKSSTSVDWVRAEIFA